MYKTINPTRFLVSNLIRNICTPLYRLIYSTLWPGGLVKELPLHTSISIYHFTFQRSCNSANVYCKQLSTVCQREVAKLMLPEHKTQKKHKNATQKWHKKGHRKRGNKFGVPNKNGNRTRQKNWKQSQ